MPTKKIGKSRVVSDTEAKYILSLVQHIDNNVYIDFLQSIPYSKLETISLNIIIMPYKNNDLIEEFLNMMFLESIIQSDSHSGKINYSLLEERFSKALPNNSSMADYIERAKKFSYRNYLNISIRSVYLNGGANDAHK